CSGCVIGENTGVTGRPEQVAHAEADYIIGTGVTVDVRRSSDRVNQGSVPEGQVRTLGYSILDVLGGGGATARNLVEFAERTVQNHFTEPKINIESVTPSPIYDLPVET